MTTVSKWTNVAVAIQSALGSELTISAITKASPGVVTSTAHGLLDGDYVVLTVEGMHQLNGRVFRVDNKTNDTIELEGEDTTLFETFTSGTMKKITFGTAMTTATGLSASGGDFDFIDTTTIHSNTRTQVPNIAAPATYTFENLWDISDAALVALKAASDNQAQRAVRFTFAGGQKVLFNGYIGATLLPTGNALDKVTTSVVVTMHGRPTMYAS